MFYIYRILAPVLIFLARVLGRLGPAKLRAIVMERARGEWIYRKDPSRPLVRPFWIHAASGEIEYARPLIRELRKEYPQVPIVVTYSSVSSRRILQNLPELDAWGPSPWDLPGACGDFLDRVAPRAALFARTDVWPELVTQTKRRKIPAILFAATFAAESSRLRGATKGITAWAFAQLDMIFTATLEDKKTLRAKGIVATTRVGGDTRYDQVLYRLQHPQKIKEELRPLDRQQILVAGSTWPEDEAVLLPWFAERPKDRRLLLAPHEFSPDRLKKITDFFAARDIGCDFYSRSSHWENPVLILDQIGILAELYSWGGAAFVGGSFKKQVHSVMEPLAAGLPVAVGPFFQNNREAQEFREVPAGPLPAVSVVQNSADFENFWLRYQSFSRPDSEAIREGIFARQGAVAGLMAFIKNLPL